MKDFTNVEMEKEGDIITLTIDTSQDNGLSKSEKSISVASTHGNVDIGNNIRLNVNCYKIDLVKKAEAKAKEDADRAEFEEFRRVKALEDNSDLVDKLEAEANGTDEPESAEA